MDPQFWIEAWQTGRTGFHRSEVNEKLVAFFDRLSPASGQRVLVPLCGKSKDMLWLLKQGQLVQGVELYQEAVDAFFIENRLPPPEISSKNNFTHFQLPGLRVSCGDFFEFVDFATFDLVYDRASLIALPPNLRKKYAERVLQLLKSGGRCLLISMEYNQDELEAPPFSVTESEIRKLYQKACRVELLDRQVVKPDGRFSHLSHLQETVYLLEKY